MRFLIDTCGIICLSITFFILLFVDYGISSFEVLLNSPNYGPNIYTFNVIIMLIITSYCVAAFSDPGILPLNFSEIRKEKFSNQMNELVQKANLYATQKEQEESDNKLIEDKVEIHGKPHLIQRYLMVKRDNCFYK